MNKPYTGVPSLKGLLIVGLFVFGGYKILCSFDTHNWPEVTGKVTGYEIWENEYLNPRAGYNNVRKHEYIPVVKYVYLIDHVTYEGKSSLQGFETRNDAVGHAASWYRKGTKVQVLYNPENPKATSLTRTRI